MNIIVSRTLMGIILIVLGVLRYKGKNFTLNHFDTYRVTVEEAIECGFDEVLSDKTCITFIEWASMIEPLIPKKNIKINIKIIDENTREIEIENKGE